jgi:hypothetical protein
MKNDILVLIKKLVVGSEARKIIKKLLAQNCQNFTGFVG